MGTSIPSAGNGKSGSDLLLSVARPDIFRRNAFRIMGLSVEATAADITRQSDKLRMTEKYGAGNRPPSAFPLMPPPDVDQIRDASDRLRDPERRLVDEFFWFWPSELGKSQTDEALAALRRREEDQAAALWRRQGDMGSTNNVSIHNLAVFMHARALDLEFPNGEAKELKPKEREEFWKIAYQMWKALLDDERFWSRLTARIRELDDPRLTTGTARRMQTSLPLALLLIQAQLALRAAEANKPEEAKWHLAIMHSAGYADTLVNEAVRITVEPLRDRIKTICKASDKESDDFPERGDQIAERLLVQCKPMLAALDIMLPAGNSARDASHDEIAMIGLGCQVVFGRKTENWKRSVEVLTEFVPVAAGAATRAKINDNLAIVRSNRDMKICFFCGENDLDEKCGIEKKLFGDVERTPNFNIIGMRTGTKITWRKRTVIVPRCLRCKKAQSLSVGWTVAAVITSIATGITACAIQSDVAGADGLNVLMLIGFSVGGSVLGGILSPRYFRKNIRPEGHADKYADVQELLKKGWRFGTEPQN